MSTHEEIFKEIIKKMGIEPHLFKAENRLGYEIGMDSQEVVEFVLATQKQFGISLPTPIFFKRTTVSEVLEIVNEKISLQEV